MMMNMLSEKYAGLGVVPACEGFDRRAGRRLPWSRAGRDLARSRSRAAGEARQISNLVKTLAFIFLLLTAMSATASDWRRSAVAACLVREAGIDGREGMTAVMDVIVNRCKLSGRTPYQEVTRRKQFSSMSVGVASAVVTLALRALCGVLRRRWVALACHRWVNALLRSQASSTGSVLGAAHGIQNHDQATQILSRGLNDIWQHIAGNVLR